MFLKEKELEKLELYAKENHIPIMQKDGIDFLTRYIEEHQIKSILEIGSAIGYSAIKMALVDPEIHVTTVERDEKRYEEAIQNLNLFQLHDQVEIICTDALDLELNQMYDLIFIDAAKSQYIKFFEKYKKNCKLDGVIISDNLNFHGYTHQKERIQSKNLRQLVGKIRGYITFLEENKEFQTAFYDVGDGIGVSKRR